MNIIQIIDEIINKIKITFNIIVNKAMKFYTNTKISKFVIEKIFTFICKTPLVTSFTYLLVYIAFPIYFIYKIIKKFQKK